MKGVIAENHFDGSRNSIVVLGGSRRYILAHPDQCDLLALYPKGHPSARHSAVDWSRPNMEEFPEFDQAKANEVVLTPGQVLYLPTEWFHYIISLELNFQCNSRSGITHHYHDHIKRCGF
jgi:ribosomal protein L16 Arg81 hydroxylase